MLSLNAIMFVPLPHSGVPVRCKRTVTCLDPRPHLPKEKLHEWGRAMCILGS